MRAAVAMVARVEDGFLCAVQRLILATEPGFWRDLLGLSLLSGAVACFLLEICLDLVAEGVSRGIARVRPA